MIVWLNGELVGEELARISPFDHGVLTGDGVFETLRVYGGTPFAWRRHLARLARSAHGLRLPPPDPDRLRRAAGDVLAANRLTEARLRITVTGGLAPLGSARGDGEPTTIVAASEVGTVPAATDVWVAPWPRNERSALAGLKTISYAENVLALDWAREREAGEAILANLAGNLCEGTGTNLFFVERGRVVTPPASAGCLLGVTRGLVLELCAALAVPAIEADRPVAALAAAEEAFLTSTVREVNPIARVDGRSLPAAPGPVTARLAAAFRDLAARDLDP
ncbi:MAG: aminotransferase class IV [Acidobacteria bacterium]|nr:aminotransferase class IV [Acidobacteriota bacterium]